MMSTARTGGASCRIRWSTYRGEAANRSAAEDGRATIAHRAARERMSRSTRRKSRTGAKRASSWPRSPCPGAGEGRMPRRRDLPTDLLGGILDSETGVSRFHLGSVRQFRL